MPRGYPGTAKAKAPTQAALLADIILELQLVNAGQERIETQKLPALGASISKLSAEAQLSIVDLHEPLDNILETLKRTFDYFVGNDLQIAEDRKEMLAALEGIRKATISERSSASSSSLQAQDKESSAPGWGKRLFFGALFGAALGVLATGFVVGLVAETTAQFAKVVKLIRESNIGEKIAEKWNKTFKWLTGEEGVLSKIRKLFSEESAIGRFFGSISKFGRRVLSFLTRVGIMGLFDSSLGWFVKIEKLLGPVFKLGKTIGKVLGKLLIPITVITALWDTIKGAYEGYQKDGIAGGLRGATIGLWNSLVGWAVDLLKDVVSFIANKLGFEEFSKMLDSWNFKDFFTKVFDSITNLINPMAEFLGESSVTPGKFNEWVGEVVDSLWVILKDSVEGLLQVLRDESKKRITALGVKAVDFTTSLIGDVLRASLPKWDNSALLGPLSPNNVAVSALKTAGVYEYVGMNPDTGKTIAPSPSKSGAALKSESSKETNSNTTIINNYGGNTTNTSSSSSASSINALHPNGGRSFATGMDYGFGF